MGPATSRLSVPGPVGDLECAVDTPKADGAPPAGLAVICHPHPLHGGTMDNKVAQTLARAALQRGWIAVRFNFRGVGGSAGTWDEGRGEVEDALAVVRAFRSAGQRLVLSGFSFGAFVAAEADARLGEDRAERRVLVGPAVHNFPMPTVPADTLVIHGELDEIVPLAGVLDWARPQHLPVVVMPGVGHFFHGQLPLLKQWVMPAFG